MGHRELVLGALPELCFGLVAAGAGLATDECRLSIRNGEGLFSEFASAELKEKADCKHGDCRQCQHP
jgi:hypothetical protein